MANAARPAHPAGPPSRAVVAVFTLGLALVPLRGHAGPAPSGPAPAEPGKSATAPAEPVDEAPVDAAPPPVEPVGPVQEGDADPASGPDGDDEPTDLANPGDTPAGEGPDEPPDDGPDGPAKTNGTQDEAVDEGKGPKAAVPGTLGPTAEPLRPMQTAAWWTMFGAFAVGTTAGVFAGLAERQEDRATRLSTLFDAETGAQPRYVDRKGEYEEYLRRGEGYAKAALGVGVVAGVATIAAITLFAVDARRQRGDRAAPARRRTTLRMRGGGVEVRF
jgi:hypothetical protein